MGCCGHEAAFSQSTLQTAIQVFGWWGLIQPEVFQIACPSFSGLLPPSSPSFYTIQSSNRSFSSFYIGNRLHWINKTHRMEGVGEAEAHFRVRQTNSQRNRRDHSLRQVQLWKEVSDEAIVSRSQQAGDGREQIIPFMGVSSRGVQSKSRKWRERNKEESQGPFSLSCHWESQLCNKACWVLIRLCGFGQERKKNKTPVTTWHLLPDSRWSRTKRVGPN